jgi:hypothetical protein
MNDPEVDTAVEAVEEEKRALSPLEKWNVFFCFLAWACNVSIVTLGALKYRNCNSFSCKHSHIRSLS